MAPRLGLWVNMVRIFLDPLRRKFYGKYWPSASKWVLEEAQEL
jgi:hypothetical protein